MKEKRKKYYFAPIRALAILSVFGAILAVFAPPIAVKIFGVALAALAVFLIVKSKNELVFEIDDEKMNFIQEDVIVYFDEVETWFTSSGGTNADIITVLTYNGKKHTVQTFNSNSIAGELNRLMSEKEQRKQNIERLKGTKEKGKWKKWFKELTKK